MHGWVHLDAAEWFWMSFVGVFWLLVLGVVVYVAVRLAIGDRHRHR